MQFKFEISAENNGRTVKSILKNEFRFSSNLIKKFKYHGVVLCNNEPAYMSHILQTGDVVEAVIQFEEQSENVKPTRMDLDILFGDDCVIALDKPPGKIIHPIGNNKDDTVANGLMYYFQSMGYHIKVRPVSRLDRDTTGVIVFAKNQFIHEKLIHQMKVNEYCKQYIGIVYGCPAKLSGTINLPIARTPGSIILREVSSDGAPSVTHYKVMEVINNASVLHFTLETGRTHQIRVHCKAIGHPLIGDTLYSDIPTNLIDRQALHSHYVRFLHPITGRTIEIASPLPQDISKLVNSLGDRLFRL